MPVVDVAHQHLITARALHRAQGAEGHQTFETLDWSGIVAGTRVAAGLDGFDSQKVSYILFIVVPNHVLTFSTACCSC